LAQARAGHLATADDVGAPHVIPICFAFDGLNLYSVLDQKPKRASLTRLRRVQNILANPQAALIVDHYEEAWDRLWYILVRGQAALLFDGPERAGAIALLQEKYPQYLDMDIETNPVIKLAPQTIVTWGVDSQVV
jgi:PPOX class probable F420-dependent enzyme